MLETPYAPCMNGGEDEVELTPFGNSEAGSIRPPVGPSRKRPAKSRDYPGVQLLHGDDPRLILRRIHEGDPLGVAQRCRRRLRLKGQLLGEGKLVNRALARIAHRAPHYDGEPELCQWIDSCIDSSIEDLIGAMAEEKRWGIPPDRPLEQELELLAVTLGIEPPLARRSVLVLNRLPGELRRVLFDLLIEGKTVTWLVAEGNGSREKVREMLSLGLAKIGAC